MPRSCLHACTLPFFRWLMNRTQWFALHRVSAWLFLFLLPLLRPAHRRSAAARPSCGTARAHHSPAAPAAHSPLPISRPPHRTPDHCSLRTFPPAPAFDPQPPPLLWPGIGWRRSPRDRARPPAPRRAAPRRTRRSHALAGHVLRRAGVPRRHAHGALAALPIAASGIPMHSKKKKNRHEGQEGRRRGRERGGVDGRRARLGGGSGGQSEEGHGEMSAG